MKDFYRDKGRPSIDPELLWGIRQIGYRYGGTSEQKHDRGNADASGQLLVIGLSFDQEIAHHSTF